MSAGIRSLDRPSCSMIAVNTGLIPCIHTIHIVLPGLPRHLLISPQQRPLSSSPLRPHTHSTASSSHLYLPLCFHSPEPLVTQKHLASCNAIMILLAQSVVNPHRNTLLSTAQVVLLAPVPIQTKTGPRYLTLLKDVESKIE